MINVLLEKRRLWMQFCLIGMWLLSLFITASLSSAQSSDESNPLRKRATDVGELAETQQRLAGRYDRLEMLAGRLAELSRTTQPRRAKLLRELIAKSHEQGIAVKFEEVLQALEQESLSSASQLQGELHGELKQLLELLLREDRERQIESERKRIRKYLAELNRLIRLQRGVRARTEGGDDAERLAKDQEQVAGKTDELQKEINETEGSEKSGGKSKKQTEDSKKAGEPSESSKPEKSSKPSEPGKPSEGKAPPSGQQGQPSGGQSEPQESSESEQQTPVERATERLKQARQRMQQAQEQLEKLQNKEAIQEQEKALEELQKAKADLERILRQLREEELERTLMMLEARFRRMLAAQIEVYDETKKLDAAHELLPTHELEIAAGRLSRKERQIVREADRALVLLREDGTSIAFPEALDQARIDMQDVATRLAAVKTAAMTQSIEEDIIAALEESLAALQQAIKKLREQKARQQKPAGQPGEQSLVDQLAELRMIRALQGRVNRRTVLYDELIEGEQALDPELLESLGKLALRQQRIFEATRDLHTGKNQ